MDLFGDNGATISDCGRYRYRLWRWWGHGPKVTFVMLNPSTADATVPDPTTTRCIGFARSWGYGSIELVNLFPWRAKDPKALVAAHKAGENIWQSRIRNNHVAAALRRSDTVVVAWGAHKLAGDEWLTMPLASDDLHGYDCSELMCFGTTKSGAPLHPLYLRADTALVPWPGQ